MAVKPGDKVLVVLDPGANGKRLQAEVLAVPDGEKKHYQIQLPSGRTRYLTQAEFDRVFQHVIKSEFGATIGEALKARLKPVRQVVDIGCKVKIETPEGATREYVLVPEGQGSQNSFELDASIPLAAAMIGVSEGETFSLPVHGSIREFKILEVTAPKAPVAVAAATVAVEKKFRSIDRKDLLDDKSTVVFEPIENCQIVTAPPGTGKSFALAHRAAWFLEKCRISPGEILILSFSREAVAEVRRRLKRYEIPNVDAIQPYTIDSYAATVLLNGAARGNKAVFESYDKSVIEATALLQAADLEKFRHIFIDEFQDVVGIRADFILKILSLKPTSCGVTLLGDLEQSIYHWALKSQDSQTRSEQFLFLAAQSLKTGDNFRYLSKNFRIDNEELKSTITGARSFLEKNLPSLRENLPELKRQSSSQLDGLTRVARIGTEKYKHELKPEKGIRKCILFRDNGQLISETELVRAMGLKVRILGKYNRGLFPGWYAAMIRHFQESGRFINRAIRYEDWINGSSLKENWGPDSAWALLKAIEGIPGRPDSLDTHFLRKKIQFLREVPFPESEMKAIHESPLVFSTYHASKGLEFDRVYLVEPNFQAQRDFYTLLDEARMFYVGLTRAKEAVSVLGTHSVSSLSAFHYQAGRIDEIRWNKSAGGIRFFNVDNESDVDPTSFIMKLGDLEVSDVQDILSSRIKEGDDLELRIWDPGSERYYRGYFIFWNDKPLGAMSYPFFDSIKRLYRGNPPLKINATVSKVYSEFKANPYSQFPLDEYFSNRVETWLALKFGGLARAER